MGVGSSKKKKAALALSKGPLNQPAPPKPLTAVSEGEEHAWSSVHVDEDKEEDLPKPPKRNVSPKTSPLSTVSKHETSTSASELQTRIESATSTEEKEDAPSLTFNSFSETTNSSWDGSREAENSQRYDQPPAVVEEPLESPSTFEEIPVTEPLVAEPPPREPTPDPLQEGGYLLFTPTSDGTLFLQYSHHKVEGAIAYFRPQKVVPAFKYRQNHGRVELIRRLQNNKQGYYEGYADFLKAAKEFESDIFIIQPVARVYYLLHGNNLHEAPMEKFFTVKVDKIAVIPPGNQCFEGVKTIHPDQFISTGNKYGKALKF